MQLSIKSRNYHFELEFHGKFNFILGNSGTFKTLLGNLLAKYKRGIHGISVKISDDRFKMKKESVHILGNDTVFEGDYKNIFNVVGHLFVIDECCEILKKRDLSSILKESKNYFIIISRKVPGFLPVSIDSVYHLERKKGMIFNVPEYAKNNGELTSFAEKIDYISTEDSASSLKVFKALFGENIVGNAKAYNGKEFVIRNNNQLPAIVENELNEKKKNILVVFDAAAFGAFYAALVKVIGKRKDISILAWESFEWFVLSGKPFNLTITKNDVGYENNSVEQLATKTLAEYMHYDKSSLPGCLKYKEHECQAQCRLKCKVINNFSLNDLLHDELDKVRKLIK